MLHNSHRDFIRRHIGTSAKDQSEMDNLMNKEEYDKFAKESAS